MTSETGDVRMEESNLPNEIEGLLGNVICQFRQI